jgi:hypothetical protein
MQVSEQSRSADEFDSTISGNEWEKIEKGRAVSKFP